MDAELIVQRGQRAPALPYREVSPWEDDLPRVRAYLRAAGIDDSAQLARAVDDIERRLLPLLPLRDGENAAQALMQETVRWVEEQQPPAGADSRVPAVPPRHGLSMPEQVIELHGWRRWYRPRSRASRAGRAAASRDDSRRDGPTAGTGPARGIRTRRAIWFSLIAATTAGAVGLMSGSMQQGGLSPLEALLILLYALLFSWICAAFWTAFMGFIVRLFGIRRWNIDSQAKSTTGARNGEAAAPGQREAPRTALVMPVYNESPEHVFARLRAIRESLETGEASADFDIFILSDTRDPDIQVEEELLWAKFCADTSGGGSIFYRHRKDNGGRKAGNIADFLRSWGGHYRYMAVLDADSLMAGATLLRMVEVLEAQPAVAILQAPAEPVNGRSLFARLLQFAATLYGPLYASGMNFWQAGDASYFGHNALIRVEPFARHGGLPSLPGREPLGGPILSHDFVEAATLRRAGWEVWLAPETGGSFEEIPPTLIDYAKRDRRWCQGNLQHGRLIGAAGWRGLSRLHFSMAVMSYLASPLWLLFLLAAGVEAWLQSRETPVYFFGDSLFPVWPTSYAFELMTVLIVTLSILFLPKIFALLLLLAEPERRAAFGGWARALSSALLESLFSVVVAPVLMLFQSKFVAAILLRRNIGWPSQRRVGSATTLREAMAAHGSQLALGILAGIIAWYCVPTFFWWFTPVLAGMLLAVPLSMFTSREDAGDAASRRGLFLTPQETGPSDVVARYRAMLEGPRQAGETLMMQPLWLAALLHPRVHALHRRLLPEEEPTRRQRHHLDGLMVTLADHSAEALTADDRRAMIANAECLRRIHIGLWSELSLQRLTQAAYSGNTQLS